MSNFPSSQGFIQKIYSSPHFICLKIRGKGQTYFYYLGRGKPYHSVFSSLTPLPSALRLFRDRALEYLRAKLEGRFCSQILSPQEGLIQIVLGPSENTQEKDCLFWAFSSRGVFIEYSSNSLCHLSPSWIGNFIPFSPSFPLEEYLKKKPEDFFSSKQKSRLTKGLQRKQEKIKQDIQKLETGLKFKEILIENTCSLEKCSSFTFETISYKMNPSWGHYKNRSYWLNKIKRYPEALIFAQKRLEECLTHSSSLHANLSSSSQAMEYNLKPLPIEIFLPKKDKKYWKEYSCDGVKIKIGQNEHQNQKLLSQGAFNEELWFHLEEYPSGHIVISLTSFEDLTPSLLKSLAFLLLESSSAPWHENCLLQGAFVKDLRAIKGHVGKVRVLKKQTFKVSSPKKDKSGIKEL